MSAIRDAGRIRRLTMTMARLDDMARTVRDDDPGLADRMTATADHIASLAPEVAELRARRATGEIEIVAEYDGPVHTDE